MPVQVFQPGLELVAGCMHSILDIKGVHDIEIPVIDESPSTTLTEIPQVFQDMTKLLCSIEQSVVMNIDLTVGKGMLIQDTYEAVPGICKMYQ